VAFGVVMRCVVREELSHVRNLSLGIRRLLGMRKFIQTLPYMGPANFNRFWLVNSVKVYQQEDYSQTATSSPYSNVTTSALNDKISLTSRPPSSKWLKVPGSHAAKSRSSSQTLRTVRRPSATKKAA
jgi:hypothetical protein